MTGEIVIRRDDNSRNMILRETDFLRSMIEAEVDVSELDAAQDILNRVARGRNQGRKRATMIAVAQANAWGYGTKDLWDRDDLNLVARGTFYNWMSDPDFNAGMKELTTIFQDFFLKTSFVNASRASMILSMGAPLAAMTALQIAGSDDENIALRASVAILDRADFMTAQKTGTLVQGSTGDAYDVNRLDDEEADQYFALLEKMKVPDGPKNRG